MPERQQGALDNVHTDNSVGHYAGRYSCWNFLDNKTAHDLKADLKGDIKDFRDDLREIRGDLKVVEADTKEMRGDLKDIKGDLRREVDRIDAKLDNIQVDLRQFYHLNGKLEGRLDSVEKRLS